MAETFDLIVRGGEVGEPRRARPGRCGRAQWADRRDGDLGQASAGEVFDAERPDRPARRHHRQPGPLPRTGHGGSGRPGDRLARRGAGRQARPCSKCRTPIPPPPRPRRWPTSLARAKNRMHCDHAFYIGGTHGERAAPGRVGAPARLLRGEGVRRLVHRLAADRRRRGPEGRHGLHQPARRLPLRRRGDRADRAQAARPARRLDQPSGGARRRKTALRSSKRLDQAFARASPASASTSCTPPPPTRSSFCPEQGHRHLRGDPAAPEPGRAGMLRAAEGLAQMNSAHPRHPPPAGPTGAASPTAWSTSSPPTIRRTRLRGKGSANTRPRLRACRACRSVVPVMPDPRGGGPADAGALHRPDQPWRQPHLRHRQARGALAVGYDADLTVVDLKGRRLIKNEAQANRSA